MSTIQKGSSERTASILYRFNLLLFLGYYCVGAWSDKYQSYFFLPMILTFLFFWRSQAPFFILAASLLSFLFTPNYLQVHRFYSPLDSDGNLVSLGSSLSKPFIFAATLVIGLSWLFITWRWLWKIRNPLNAFLTFSLVIFLGWYSLSFLEPSTPLHVFLFLILACASRTSISLIYFAQANIRPAAFWQMQWAYPFWQTSIPAWDARPLPSVEKLEPKEYLSITKSLLAIFASIFVVEKIPNLIALFHGDKHLLFLSVYTYPIDGSVLSGWLYVWLNGIHFIVVGLWAPTSTIVLLLNNLGYRMPLPFNNPFAAKSFSDFFSRMFFYYSKIMIFVVYVPLYRATANLTKSKSIRKNTALFASVFLFSLVFHFLRDYGIFLGQGAGLAAYASSYGLYSILLAVLITASSAFEQGRKLPPALQSLRFFSYFTAYSLLIQVPKFATSPLSERLNFLASLFGGPFGP